MIEYRTPCMHGVRSYIVAYQSRYRGKDANISAWTPLYNGVHATAMKVNTTILVLTPCMHDFNIWKQVLKSYTKEGILGSRKSKKWGREEKIEGEYKIMYVHWRA